MSPVRLVVMYCCCVGVGCIQVRQNARRPVLRTLSRQNARATPSATTCRPRRKPSPASTRCVCVARPVSSKCQCFKCALFCGITRWPLGPDQRGCPTPGPVSTRMGDRSRVYRLQPGQLSLAAPSWVATVSRLLASVVATIGG